MRGAPNSTSDCPAEQSSNQVQKEGPQLIDQELLKKYILYARSSVFPSINEVDARASSGSGRAGRPARRRPPRGGRAGRRLRVVACWVLTFARGGWLGSDWILRSLPAGRVEARETGQDRLRRKCGWCVRE